LASFKQPQNAALQFKCSNCGLMFTAQGQERVCPGCGYYCNQESCRTLEASDEGY